MIVVIKFPTPFPNPFRFLGKVHNINPVLTGITDDILSVVYTDRIRQIVHGVETDVTRIISARYATEFERGLYYGKLNDWKSRHPFK